MRTLGIGILAASVIGLVSSVATAQTVTPMKGQTSEQMATDKTECQSIAQQSAAATPPPAAAPQRGAGVRGAARGAAVGAAVADRNGGEVYNRASEDAQQEYRQEKAKDAAKAGAVVARGQQRRSNVQAAQQQQASSAQATDAAFRSCLAGRGYQVQ